MKLQDLAARASLLQWSWRWLSQPPVALPVTPPHSLSHPLRACHIFLHLCFKPLVIFFPPETLGCQSSAAGEQTRLEESVESSAVSTTLLV